MSLKSYPMPKFYAVFLLVVPVLTLTSCEDVDQLLNPQIVPVATPKPPEKQKEEELAEIGTPRPVVSTPAPMSDDLLPHPATYDIKELWEKTSVQINSDIDYLQSMTFEDRLAKAKDLRNQWWQLSKRLLQNPNVDITTIKVYSPLIDTVINGIDAIYAVNSNDFSSLEETRARTEYRILSDRITRLK